MKLLFIIYGRLDQTSGGYLYDRRVIGSLRHSGDQVSVMGLRRIPFPLCVLQSLSPRLRRVFRKSFHDCVVVDELVHPAVFLALPRRGAARPAVVTLVHHLRCSESMGGFRRKLSRVMEKQVASRSHSVIVNSRTTAETVRALIGTGHPEYICPPGRDTLADGTGPCEQAVQVAAGNPVQMHTRTGQPAANRAYCSPLQLLTVGNLIPRKGHRNLFEALALVPDLDWRCTVAGGGADRSYLRALRTLVADLGLRNRVSFAGRVPDSELCRLYREADLFIFPSEYEGFGIALAEAVCQGVPYIASDRGAVRELVSMGTGLRAGARQQGGYLVPGGDPGALAKTLRSLLENRAKLAELSREALQLSRALPTWDDTGACFRRALAAAVAEAVS